MKFVIVDGNRQAVLVMEDTAYAGVKRIAGKVIGDIELVTGKKLTKLDTSSDWWKQSAEEYVIFAGTIGRSAYLEKLEQAGRLDLSKVRGMREVYSFTILKPEAAEEKPQLIIAGSDKRGTIYGLFHLSELLEVSPWVYMADVLPKKKERVIFTEQENFISREPSVKYRGFFINDEWPSFGNWTMSHFGGFTAEMYDHVFELLLRMKGNYLWPAMWTSNFSLDGPGLLNAELADEYGIVMSNSHHEPCLRHSEEWDLVRGEDSVYGNAWNFDQNKEGLKNYWRDGLKRNGGFENIITMGMRGERDSTILGHDASLKDNIDYLKEVIVTQNKLIQETIHEDLSQVPRMLALYKEVEAYYYGDEYTEGLEQWDELDGITLMLCEDNFGNMRTLPTKENRNRDGGWGMYYHFDYHGDPVSYEWVNSTYLAKVWEQMGQAYEFGVRDIWVVNVGDLKPQELPLSYFMDLAYDFEKWGTTAPNQTEAYTRQWIALQFAGTFDEADQEKIFQIVDGYTRLNSIRKPEALYTDTYHPVHYGEADWLLAQAERITALAEELLKKIDGKNKKYKTDELEHNNAAFYELVYFPAAASMNLIQMQLFAGKNELYAKQGRVDANRYASMIGKCIVRDKALQESYHAVMNGKWDKLMLSEHVGFIYWNDEECRYPLRYTVEPANKPRMIVSVSDSEEYTMGGDWTRKTLALTDFIKPEITESRITLANGSLIPFYYKVLCQAEWLQITPMEGSVKEVEQLKVMIDRKKLVKTEEAEVWIETSFSKVRVQVKAAVYEMTDTEQNRVINKALAAGAGLVTEEGLVIEAEEFTAMHSAVAMTEAGKAAMAGEFIVLKPYGKYKAGVKAFPVTAQFTPGENSPSLSYELVLPDAGKYEITVQSAPSNPVDARNHLCFGIQWDEENVELVNTVSKEYRAGVPACEAWAKGVMDNIHNTVIIKEGNAGVHTLTIYACDPGFVLERILVRRTETSWKKGYLAPVSEIFDLG